MALIKYLRGVKLGIKVSDMDPDTPEFAQPCLINAARSIKLTATTNDITVPDCSDPDLLAYLVREKKALSADVTGAGVLNTPDTSDYVAWLASPDPRDVRVELLNVSLANGGGWIAAQYHLVDFEFSGDRGDLTNCSVAMTSTGAFAWHAAAA